MWNKMRELNGEQPERRQHKSDPFTGRTKAPLAPLHQIPGQMTVDSVLREMDGDRRLTRAQRGQDTISGRKIA